MNRMYCGYNYRELNDMMDALLDLEDDIVLTEREQLAMDIAIQALCSILNAMAGNGKVVIDG